MIDFQERLADLLDEVITQDKLDIPLFNDLNDTDESLALYSLPGSTTVRSFFDGSKDKRFNYSIQGKSKDRNRVFDIVTKLADVLDGLDDIKSANGSFEFNLLTVSSEPFYRGNDENGFFYFQLTFSVELTIY